MYKRQLQAVTKTDEVTPEESLAGLKKLGARVQRNDQGEIIQVDLGNTSNTDTGLKHLKVWAKLQ